MKKAVITFLLLTTFSYLYSANFKDMTNIQEEIWKDVIGFEGLYEVSNNGRVRSLPREFIKSDGTWMRTRGTVIHQNTTHDGYAQIILLKNGRKHTKKAHRYVAIKFIENPNNLPQVNHIDGNKKNNHVSNLEWCDGKHNQQHAVRTGLRKKYFGADHWNSREVYQLSFDGFLVGVYPSIVEAAKSVNRDVTTVHKVLIGTRKSCAGFKWTY